METWIEVPPEFSDIDKTSKVLLKEISASLASKFQRKKMPSDTDLSPIDFKGKYWFIRAGQISCVRQNKLMFVFQEGDLLGLDAIHQMLGLRLRTQFAVEFDEISISDFNAQLSLSPKCQGLWAQYLSTQLSLLSLMLSQSLKGEFDPTTFMRTYEPGTKIIDEGSAGVEVFTMMEGYADVFVNTIKVGEIRGDELFGLMSALTNRPRNATVIAATHCLVVAMPKEHFVEFMKTRPATVLKMVEDMSRTINELNQRVVATVKGA